MTSSLLPEVEIYSDGGANPNPGPGAYGVILKYKGVSKNISQGYKRTTNNRMELLGAITGLKQLKVKSKVMMYTDSQYTINGIQKGWAKKWRSNNWFRTGSQKAINADLWAELLGLTEQHEVTFHWIKGHNGHIENEFCDEMATLAMQGENLLIDEGFLQEEEKNSVQNSLLHPSGIASQKSVLPGKGREAGKSKENIGEKTNISCKKCGDTLLKKIPKHTKKTLEKTYYYEYYHFCPGCQTNFMPEEAKRDVKGLEI